MTRSGLLSILVAVLMLPTLRAQDQPAKRRVDILTGRFLLANQLYQDLEARLTGYQTALEEDISKEADLDAAMGAFELVDGELERQLSVWISKAPRSAMALAARARYALNLALEEKDSPERLSGLNAEQAMNRIAGYLRQATRDARSALRLNPKLSAAWGDLIACYSELNDMNARNAAYADAIKALPSSLLVRMRFVWTLGPQFGGSYETMNAFAVDAQKDSTRNPKVSVLLGAVDLNKAAYLLRTEQYESALEYTRKAMRYGESLTSQQLLASAYAGMKKFEDALKACDAGLEKYWQDLPLLDLKAFTLRNMGRGDEARKVEAIARQLRSHVPASLSLTSGSAADSTGPVAAVTDTLSPAAAVSFDSTSTDGTLDGAFALLRGGKYDAAVAAFDAAAGTSSDTARLRFGRGTALIHLGRFDEAIADLGTSVSLNPGNPGAFYNLGWVFLHTDRYEEGIAANAEAIRLAPSFGYAYLNRAFGLRMFRRMEEAGADLQRACSLGVQQACALLREPAPSAEAQAAEGN